MPSAEPWLEPAPEERGDDPRSVPPPVSAAAQRDAAGGEPAEAPSAAGVTQGEAAASYRAGQATARGAAATDESVVAFSSSFPPAGVAAPPPVAPPAPVRTALTPEACDAELVEMPADTALILPPPLVIGRDVTVAEPRIIGQSSRYRPDTIVDGGHADGLTVRAASVRGRLKRHDGGLRQDDVRLAHLPEQRAIVIAVADGMGSAARGDIGARIACSHATEEVGRQLEAGAALDALDWRRLFDGAAAHLVAAFREHADREEADLREVSRDLGTTLLVAVAQRHGPGMRVAAAALGDSPAFALRGDAWEQLVGAGEEEDDDGFATSAVVALPYVPDLDVWCGRLRADDVLVLASDGFAKPLGNGRNDLGATIASALREPPALATWPYLVDFVRRSYDDDRTIAAVWARDI